MGSRQDKNEDPKHLVPMDLTLDEEIRGSGESESEKSFSTTSTASDAIYENLMTMPR